MKHEHGGTGSGHSPSDTEELVGGTAASDSLTERARSVQPSEAEAREGAGPARGGKGGEAMSADGAGDAVRGSAKTGGLPASRNTSDEPGAP